ncbi:hypothetical protein ACP70R_043288 [Stipagrostis hirtigluma subsp. patula]
MNTGEVSTIVDDSQVGNFEEEKDEMNTREVPPVVGDSQVGNFEEAKDTEKSKEVEKQLADPFAYLNPIEESTQLSKKRRFEGMLVLEDIVHTRNKGAPRRTRSHFNSKSKYKDPNRGTHAHPIDVSDSDSEVDMPDNISTNVSDDNIGKLDSSKGIANPPAH